MSSKSRATQTYVFVLLAAGAQAQPSQPSFTKLVDITYATVNEHQFKLDLYLPSSVSNAPLLLYVHGGAWSRGSKDRIPTMAFVEQGSALASVEFRLSGDAVFPAQVYDIKAAIRFLRGAAEVYGYDSSRIAVLGTSSGGHLAALVGTTNSHPLLEGQVGEHLAHSSDVAAIVSYYGASNLLTILQQSTPHGLSVRAPALEALFGAPLGEAEELARLASPVVHVDESDPPLLLLHGDQDPQMPINQSHELHYAYKRHKLMVEFIVVHDAAHGGAVFTDMERNAVVLNFLDQHLRGL